MRVTIHGVERVYVETSIFGYLASKASRQVMLLAHQRLTHAWWRERRHAFDLYVSELVLAEAAQGDTSAASKRLRLLRGIPSLALTDEARELAECLVREKAIPKRAAADALHVATAAVHEIDYVVTWNCRHIANAQIRRKVEDACSTAGFVCPLLCTPEELMGESSP